MNLDELNIILAKGESIRTEYKQARDKVPGSFYDTVVSFLNREGGVIVLGADNDGRITGIDLSIVEQLKKDIVTALNNKEVINPPSTSRFISLRRMVKSFYALKFR